jgi:hypothetical protein
VAPFSPALLLTGEPLGPVHGPVPEPFFAVAAITLFLPNQSLSSILAPLSLQDLTAAYYGRFAFMGVSPPFSPPSRSGFTLSLGATPFRSLQSLV